MAQNTVSIKISTVDNTSAALNAANQALKNLGGSNVQRQVRANPGDASLAKKFERLKAAARSTEAEFIGGREATEGYGRALAAQGVSVRSLAADYAKLRTAQASSSPISANPTAATRSIARPSATPLATPVTADVSRSIDNLNQAVRGGIATVGHYGAAFIALQAALFKLPGAAARASDEHLKIQCVADALNRVIYIQHLLGFFTRRVERI
jgi:hypothetical protein